MLVLVGCGPVKLEKSVEVGPSETAYLVALETDAQGKFESIEYLEQQKVAAKRILLPQRDRKTGRMWFEYEWIPTARVIKVDRKPVSRKWTTAQSSDPTTAPLEVESLDSIGFAVGVTTTARIDEKEASRFLYYHAGRQLEEVIDTNIKSFVLAGLSTEFGKYNLTEARKKKNEIFEKVEKEATVFFKERGITIEYMGLSEGLTYEMPEIQKAIDNSFVAEQSKITAQQEQEAAKIQNQTLIAKVAAESEAANRLAQNLNAAMAKQRLEIEKLRVEAQLEMAKKWNGQLPTNIIPSNNPFLTNLFGAGK